MKPELIVDAPILGQKKIWIKEVVAQHFNHPFHFHKLCEITWVEKGNGTLIIGDYVGNFFDNELVLSSPELPHLWKCDAAYYQKDKKLFTKAMGLYFPNELIHKICDDVEIISSYNKLMQKAERGIRFYGKTKEEIIKRLKDISSENGLAQLGTFLHIIHVMSSSNEYKPLANVGYRSVNNGSDIERFNAVYQYLLKNFSSEIMLEEVAAICNMTETSFCRYFKQKTQKTFTYFLNEIRIGHAKKLLQNENHPIKDICYECGYNNPTNFFKFFKLIAKKTPHEYRKLVTKMNNDSLN